MQLDGRRQSTNVDDRRTSTTVKIGGGIGLGGLIVVGILTLLLGGNPAEVVEMASQMGGTTTEQQYTPTAEEEELAVFAKQILAGTEDVWTKIFRANGLTYEPPKLVLFKDYVQTASGTASAASGPFYNSGDQCVYLDLSFFTSMKRDIGADGDFA